jgi:hypothetical protein
MKIPVHRLGFRHLVFHAPGPIRSDSCAYSQGDAEIAVPSIEPLLKMPKLRPCSIESTLKEPQPARLLLTALPAFPTGPARRRLASLIAESATASGISPAEGDVIVVARLSRNPKTGLSISPPNCSSASRPCGGASQQGSSSGGSLNRAASYVSGRTC